MNPWTVLASSEAEEELADIRAQAADRKAVTAAQFAIEQRLARNPIDEGVEVAEGLWKIVSEPLTAYYELDNDERLVILTHFKQQHGWYRIFPRFSRRRYLVRRRKYRLNSCRGRNEHHTQTW